LGLNLANHNLRVEREVKRANRDLTTQLAGYDSPMARIDAVQKKYTILYGDMKKLERDYQKSKKRADTLQKEKDAAKSELNKTNSLKEKLEKLSRETNNENRKLRVCCIASSGNKSGS
jgi:chromosome segregation ATPase